MSTNLRFPRAKISTRHHKLVELRLKAWIDMQGKGIYAARSAHKTIYMTDIIGPMLAPPFGISRVA